VESVYRLFTNRNFRICSKDGSPIGYARSIWAMIDMQTRKPADLFQLHGGSIVEYCTDELDCPIERPGRIKVTQTEPVSVFKSKYSDIDINGHVNSIRYIEHIMDLFSLDYLKNHTLKRFEMAYSAESYYGDELRIYQEETNQDSFDLEIRRMVGEKEEVCVKSKIFFK
jgi:acyl-ACP thioesterase